MSKAKEEGDSNRAAARSEATARAGLGGIGSYQPKYMTVRVAVEFQMRRLMLGKSSQTLMPQKWLRARMQACPILCIKSKQNLNLTGAGLQRL